MLNILHTSDWHLGKKLYKFDRHQEHELFLEWLLKAIDREKIDLLLIAGDIFDTPNPSNQAQKLFYDFIFELGSRENLNTIVIAGNHDSPSLLEIPKYFFKKSNCFMVPYLEKELAKNEIVITANEITVGIKTLPYFRNHELLNLLDGEAPQEFFEKFFSTWKTTQKLNSKILVSHHGFGKYSASGSEHAIYLSGMDYFPLDWIKPFFNYSALGHIHKKQTLCQDPPIVYPGSPLPLRFSESNHKYVSMVRVGPKDQFQKYIDIPNFRKLIRIKSDQNNYLKILAKELENITEDELPAFLEVEIKLEQAISGLADNIRQFIQKHNVELVSFRPLFEEFEISSENSLPTSEIDIFEMFQNYYSTKFPENKTIPTEVATEFKLLVEEVRDENSQTDH